MPAFESCICDNKYCSHEGFKHAVWMMWFSNLTATLEVDTSVICVVSCGTFSVSFDYFTTSSPPERRFYLMRPMCGSGTSCWWNLAAAAEAAVTVAARVANWAIKAATVAEQECNRGFWQLKYTTLLQRLSWMLQQIVCHMSVEVLLKLSAWTSFVGFAPFTPFRIYSLCELTNLLEEVKSNWFWNFYSYCN